MNHVAFTTRSQILLSFRSVYTYVLYTRILWLVESTQYGRVEPSLGFWGRGFRVEDLAFSTYNWVVADQFPGLQLEYIIYSEVFVGHITFPLVSTIKLGTGWEGRTWRGLSCWCSCSCCSVVGWLLSRNRHDEFPSSAIDFVTAIFPVLYSVALVLCSTGLFPWIVGTQSRVVGTTDNQLCSSILVPRDSPILNGRWSIDRVLDLVLLQYLLVGTNFFGS